MPPRPLRFPATAKDKKVLARLRKLCLALPEVTETNAFGHPNFRAGKVTFCAFEPCQGRPSVGFKLPREDVTAMLISDDRFFPTPYGRGVWLSLWADGTLDWTEIEALELQSYRGAALKRMLAALNRDT